MSVLDTAPEVAPRGASPIILLDADYLAYMVGGISQAKERDPSTTGQEYVCIDEMKDIWVWADPIELVKWRVDNEIDKIKDRLGSDTLEVWLTPDEGNFRIARAVTKPYKGGRSSVRPYHYRAIREHLLHIHKAEVAVECEADDMVCTRQMECSLAEEKSVIVGPDKDLKCMFGAHYDPRKDIEEWITWEQAALNFYGQMIVGDSVDNIPGCKRKGIAYWNKILKEVEDLTGWELVTEVECLMMEAYEHSGHNTEYMLEQADLLHMRRFDGDMWDIDYNWETGYNVELS